MTRSSLVLLVFGVALPFATGCTSQDQPVGVSGTVALDGKPVSNGRILFVGNDGSPPEVVNIKDGSFDGKVRPGKRRVEISALRKTGRKNAFWPNDEEMEDYIPVRYNVQSELSEEIPPEGKSGLKYDLKSSK